MSHSTPEGWMTLVQEFEALGAQADAAVDTDAVRVSALLAERDALLAQLAEVLADRPAEERARAGAALQGATESTAALISKVAERTDALRTELRTLGRGARAQQAYFTGPDTRGQVNARR